MDVIEPTPTRPRSSSTCRPRSRCTRRTSTATPSSGSTATCRDRDRVILSLHPHNDRGTAVAAAEFGLMAGADRVEGTLFGNGERTGNVDVVTLAMNLFSQGVDPELDISDIDALRRDRRVLQPAARRTRAIPTSATSSTPRSRARTRTRSRRASRRCRDRLRGLGGAVPAHRPQARGPHYEAVIRVNSQSGKGGVAYIMKAEHGFDLPRRLQIEFSRPSRRSPRTPAPRSPPRRCGTPSPRSTCRDAVDPPRRPRHGTPDRRGT